MKFRNLFKNTRVLADDLGHQLGCGAVLAELRRTRCGPLKIESSVGIERLKEMLTEEFRPLVLIPFAPASKGQPAVQ